ncbi:hypothetical protein FPZ12_018225 [Amycolatopsis acidicola]|uniref:RHS repeat protein n=1 Tax=Amycolatopsis acidicola TaxID=2596893 RepID=A0A5N0V4Y3_9PSEU|nr:hypothetical protein [Amycolatopsis acidicola]KAA9160153.1 hypothetical protein FPZ12_018225 [Amycolatopsis acidicola]
MADAGEDWALTKAKLTHDPHEMEGYGNNVASIGKNFQSDINGPVQLIRGGGEETQVSTGHFPEGDQIQQLLSRNATEMSQFLQAAYQSVVALSSVALIYSELLRTTDLNGSQAVNAIDWAFAIPGADKPKGLPSFVDNSTLQGEMSKVTATDTTGEKLLSSHEVGNETFSTYSLAGGGIHTVVQGPGGNKTEAFYDKNGNLITETVVAGGRSTTTTYSTKTGEKTGRTLKISGANGAATTYSVDVKTGKKSMTSQTYNVQSAPGSTSITDVDNSNITVRYNSEGKVTQTVTKHDDSVYNSDGTYTRKYYTETETADGKTTTSDVREITEQPQAVTSDAWNKVIQESIDDTSKKVEGH